jgi:hypothetical protein
MITYTGFRRTGLSQWGGVQDNRVKSAGAEDRVM